MAGLDKAGVRHLPGRRSVGRRLDALEDKATVAVGAHAHAVAVLQPRLDACLPRQGHSPLLIDHRLSSTA
jgi:hypothetical protein